MVVSILIDLFNIELLSPILASISAIVGLLISYRAFKDKPITLSIWLYSIFGFYIPWGIATVFMRIANEAETARILLQISFISLQFASYSVFRFHYNLIEKQGNRYLINYSLGLLATINMALSFDPSLLAVKLTESGYYIDQFAPFLLVMNLMMNVGSGAYAVRTLFQMGVFGEFYAAERGKNIIYALIGVILVVTLVVLLGLWLVDNTNGSADVTLFILLTIPVLLFIAYTYGIRPISDFIIPQRLWGFVMISPTGITVFERSLADTFNTELLHLLGSALHVTNFTFQRHLNSDSSLRVAEMQDRVIMINDKEDFMFCIIADYRTYQIDILLRNFSDVILSEKRFQERKPFEDLSFLNRQFDDFFKYNERGIGK